MVREGAITALDAEAQSRGDKRGEKNKEKVKT